MTRRLLRISRIARSATPTGRSTRPRIGRMYWLFRIMARRRKRPALVRWLGTLALFAVALAARALLGYFGGGLPALTFFPVLLIVTVLFGWVEALAVLMLSATAGVVGRKSVV